MSHPLYLNILWDNLKLSIQNLSNGNSFIFYHGNNPKHMALNVCNVRLYNCPQVLKMPPQLADLNPREKIWRKQKVKIQNCDIKMKSKLKTVKLLSDKAACAI